MNKITKLFDAAKYLARQSRDITQFGHKTVSRENVTTEILDSIVPFRRLSNRPVSLSDPKWFISKFEKEAGESFLPLNWQTMTEAEKVEHIVHRRYSKLVSNKIMNKIKDNDVEHLYSLDKDGEIIGFSSGVHDGVGKGILSGTRITIHNHPNNGFTTREISAIGNPRVKESHSSGDVGSSIQHNIDSYVVDWQGSKFLLEPAQKFTGTTYSRGQVATKMNMWVDMAMEPSYTIDRLNSKLEKCSGLEEFATTKFRDLSDMFERGRAQIREFADKRWCKFTELS